MKAEEQWELECSGWAKPRATHGLTWNLFVNHAVSYITRFYDLFLLLYTRYTLVIHFYALATFQLSSMTREIAPKDRCSETNDPPKYVPQFPNRAVPCAANTALDIESGRSSAYSIIAYYQRIAT